MALMTASRETDPLRDRLRRDGFLYLPGFLDPGELAVVEKELRAALREARWLAADATATAMASAGRSTSTPVFRAMYPALQRIESFHRLGHNPRLHDLMATLLDGPVFCHAAKVARVTGPTSPERRASTRAHQDFVKLQVATDVLTAWIALTPCTARRQGVRVIPGSHLDGFLPTDPAIGEGLPVYLPVAGDDPRWLSAEFEVGDLVVFHSLTVHGGGPNLTDTYRLSVDVRYQRTADPLLADHVHPHGWPHTPDWPEITRGWDSDEWIRTPPEVDLVSPPACSFAEVLATLTAPPSRLLGR